MLILRVLVPHLYIHNPSNQARRMKRLCSPVITSSYCAAGLHYPESLSTFHTSSQHSLPLSRSQNRLTNSRGMWKTSHLCVCMGCVSDSVRKGFFLLPSDSAAPLQASQECKPANTMTLPSRPVSGRTDRSIPGSQSDVLICGFVPGVAWILNNIKHQQYESYWQLQHIKSKQNRKNIRQKTVNRHKI